MTQDTPAVVAAPVPMTGRLPLLDTLRALALFGVIVMNTMGMVMALVSEQVMADAQWWDMAVGAFDLLFLRGKARAIFAFLFGVGFAVLLLRAEARGQAIVPFYLRRMLVLLGFGIVNQLFLFWGDILISYAVMGMLLLLFRRLSERGLLLAGTSLLVLPPILVGACEALVGPFPALLPGDPDLAYERMLAVFRTAPYGADVIAANGSHLISEWSHATGYWVMVETGVLGLFLLGLYVARRGIAFDVASHRALLRRVAWVALPLGFALSALSASRAMGWAPAQPWAGLVTASYSGLAILAFGYMAVIVPWLQRHGEGLQRWLAPMGRMALSNYLLSGVAGCWIFYAWGLGWLDRVSLAGTNSIGVGLFVLLLGFSHLWLRFFRLGPAEWLWRKLAGAPAEPRGSGIPITCG